MAYKGKPKDLPLRPEVGPRLGSGQDNAVYDLLASAPKPHLRIPIGWVAKINHDHSDVETSRRLRHPDQKEAVWRGIQYNSNKYQMLKHFLGEYIPDSAFVMTSVREGQNERPVEMTLQRKVPDYTIGNLSEAQRADPRLRANLSTLLGRMQHMYRVLGEANARSKQGASLDAKLDLGGLSDTVRSERLDHVFDEGQIDTILETNNSPNLLVDPGSMQLYCVDFDQGQWMPGMDDALEMALEIDRQHKEASPAIGAAAVHAA